MDHSATKLAPKQIFLITNTKNKKPVISDTNKQSIRRTKKAGPFKVIKGASQDKSSSQTSSGHYPVQNGPYSGPQFE